MSSLPVCASAVQRFINPFEDPACLLHSAVRHAHLCLGVLLDTYTQRVHVLHLQTLLSIDHCAYALVAHHRNHDGGSGERRGG